MQAYPPPWVAVLSVIYWLIGVFLTLWGLTLICIAIVAAGEDAESGEEVAAAAIAGIVVLGVIALCIGPVSCAVGSGLWGLNDWAWSGALALAFFWLLAGIASLATAAVVAPGLAAIAWPSQLLPQVALLGGLCWPTIRQAFFAPVSRPLAPQQSGQTAHCRNRSCGRPLHAGWSYCPYCLASVVTA